MICLLANCCFLSETSRMLELHRALVARGAQVCVATHGGVHEQLLREEGVAYDVLGEGFDAERCARFVRSVPGLGPPGQSMWTDDEIRTLVATEATYFADRGVRVAVTGWILTALLSTRLAGIPLVTEHAGAFLPPLFERGLLPAPSARMGIPLERWLPDAVRRRMFNARVDRLDLYTGAFNRAADELGVIGVPSFPALLLGDLTLVTDVPEVLGVSRADVDGWTPRRPDRYRPGTRLRYSGPMFARMSAAIPERVAGFLATSQTVVYVAITSSTADLVREVVTALRPLHARILVAGTVHDLEDLEDEQVMVGGVLPSHAILPQVDLAVGAGGQGTVQSALAAGVPLIGIPLQPEQDANVVLAQRAGAARLVALRDAGTERMTHTASAVLGDTRHRDAARRIKDVFAQVDGSGAGAEAIIGLARG